MGKRQQLATDSHPPGTEQNLPEGWAWATLDRLLCLMESGSRPKGGVREIRQGVPSIGGEHLNGQGGFRFDRVKFVPDSYYQAMRRGHVAVGDILVVKDGATTGKVSLVCPDFPYKQAVVNEHVFICRPAPGIRADFLFRFLFSERGQREILANFQGSAQGGINQTFALGTSIPVAPTAEQERIVRKVEALLSRINAARERLATVPAILKRFRQSVLAAASSGRLTADWRESHADVESATALLIRIRKARARTLSNYPGKSSEIPPDFCTPLQNPDLWEIPHTWCFTECGLVSDPDRVLTYGVIKLGEEQPGGVPTLRSSDVRWLEIDESGIKRIAPEVAEQYSRTFLSGGEIVITVRGTLGGVAVVPPHMKGYNVSREVAVIPIVRELDAAFFAFAIADMRVTEWIAGVLKGEVYTGINIRDLKFLPLPVPPIQEQCEIVRRVEAVFKLADAIERHVALATARAHKLTQSILAKAFRGELVPTEAELARREGREYETAAELLTRIRATGAQHDTIKRERRGRASAAVLS
jgi:type I restriction enzyme, S subunit